MAGGQVSPLISVQVYCWIYPPLISFPFASTSRASAGGRGVWGCGIRIWDVFMSIPMSPSVGYCRSMLLLGK